MAFVHNPFQFRPDFPEFGYAYDLARAAMDETFGREPGMYRTKIPSYRSNVAFR